MVHDNLCLNRIKKSVFIELNDVRNCQHFLKQSNVQIQQ